MAFSFVGKCFCTKTSTTQQAERHFFASFGAILVLSGETESGSAGEQPGEG
jgi:hypothetical protein